MRQHYAARWNAAVLTIQGTFSTVNAKLFKEKLGLASCPLQQSGHFDTVSDFMFQASLSEAILPPDRRSESSGAR